MTFESKKAAEKAVGLNERRLEGGKKIRATLVESRATLWDAIRFITEKLEAEERKAMKMGHPHPKENQEYRRRTWVVEGEAQKSQASVAGLMAEPKPDRARQAEGSSSPPQIQQQQPPPPRVGGGGPQDQGDGKGTGKGKGGGKGQPYGSNPSLTQVPRGGMNGNVPRPGIQG